MKAYSRQAPLTIVCYGDSNTKYYLGDLQQDGPEALSYPHRLQQLFLQNGFSNVRVLNCGFPDTRTDFALEHFTSQVTDNHADICILGFGTNCINKPAPQLAPYLQDMEQLFARCYENGVQPMCLLLPWFSEDYCGIEGQQLLPRWNGALAGLCMEHHVPLLDTYSSFYGQPERFFNEKQTPRRHYSPAATDMIAELAYAMIAPCLR